MADVAAGTVTEYRNDTGEAVRTRPMSDEERQSTLPLEAVTA